MKRRVGITGIVLMLIAAVFALPVLATNAEMYFASDKNGQNRVTNIQEGDEIWIVVIDNDENIDCDVRDKIWTDVKIMDPKTGAYIVWKSYMSANGDSEDDLFDSKDYQPYKGHSPGPGAGWLGADYLEETGADTGLFVSKRVFRIGTRVDYSNPAANTHSVDNVLPPASFLGGCVFYWFNLLDAFDPAEGLSGGVRDFMYSGGLPVPIPYAFSYADMYDWALKYRSIPAYFPPPPQEAEDGYILGRFENMDTLVGMYQDPNDPGDVAIAMMKIIDTEATISWSEEIYKDGNESATITIVDPDENLSCSDVEYVPVFIIVNPGSWNPVRLVFEGGSPLFQSPTNFCMLKQSGGVAPIKNADWDIGYPLFYHWPSYSINWYNIYGHGIKWSKIDPQYVDDAYYIEYATQDDADVTWFDTVDAEGMTRVSFYAQETGADTGVFQLNLNSILDDLGFKSLRPRDVLVAYYLDPNDEDDFKLTTAYIEERQHSVTSFTNAARQDQDVSWIGRDPVYVRVNDANANVDPCCPEQVVVHICDVHDTDDAEWVVLDETSSNSPVFFTFAGMKLNPVWDAMGIGSGLAGRGGYQLRLDNWRFEVYNEDDVYARYNDVYYTTTVRQPASMALNDQDLSGLGDLNVTTAFPPTITRVRAANDVSFDMMSVADTQVFDGSTVNMFFLDRQGNRVSGYVNSDCLFIEVLDPDQDEDQYRRERIDGYWDGGQNAPFGPIQETEFGCDYERGRVHPLNALLGDTNIFNDAPSYEGETYGLAKLYVLNPRNGRWAAVDLLETGPATGDFVSVICIDLTHVYECVPTLGVLPGDTIIAVYQDPSNHSDSAWISIKVGMGGGGTPPSQQSTTMFVDAGGNEVATYSDADDVYVKVIDPSHAGATLLASAVEIDGVEYDVTPFGAADTFITAALDLDLTAGQAITATYTDPADLTDTSGDTITIIARVLSIDSFYAGPNPFDAEVTFGFNGTGIATTMSVTVYDLAGGLVWESTQTDATGITWDGLATSGDPLANGCYIYVITATDGTNTFDGNGKVFVNR